ncbi:uncharacterized protein LOC109595484 [Aethina tumida]|uniref:uncharacterized protein LOC109595484 n=1 Tax=Aethina tumida TaxID=116153 RepID=UPI00096AF7F4|nr:uncharacterized protein LOC109595484 [Aethina tumida]
MKFKPNESVLRVALIIFCVIFGVLSISLISLGVVYMDDLWWPRRYVGLDFLALPTLVIILGSISFLMSIIGCWYAKTYNRKFFIGFICVLVVILCLELTISIISFDNMTGSKEKHIRKIMEEEAANMTNGFKEFKDHVSWVYN